MNNLLELKRIGIPVRISPKGLKYVPGLGLLMNKNVMNWMKDNEHLFNYSVGFDAYFFKENPE